MFKILVVAFCLCLTLSFLIFKQAIPLEDNIAIIPVGKIDKELVNFVKGKLEDVFKLQVKIKNNIKIPEDSYNTERKQYLSSKILDYVCTTEDINSRTVLVIDKDLYVPRLNFVFGEADPIRDICMFSIIRLKQSFYGLSEDKGLLYKRAIKEAVHELGHTYGLKHCDNPDCVMYFSNSLSDTDKKSYHFCPYHKKRLKK